eukprot:Trichotokara_eunicae@DN5533_c0_g1_i1.p2
MEEKYDGVLLGIAKSAGDISNFLDAVFGFLSRNTDFYQASDGPARKKVVIGCLSKWEEEYQKRVGTTAPKKDDITAKQQKTSPTKQKTESEKAVERFREEQEKMKKEPKIVELDDDDGI